MSLKRVRVDLTELAVAAPGLPLLCLRAYDRGTDSHFRN
jgi:hypothetical protein